MILQQDTLNKILGMFLGKVVKHLSHGVLKVFIPTVYPNAYESIPDKLPDCYQIVPLIFGNVNGNGIYSYPNIGSTVVCFFMNGDLNFPMTFGSIQAGQDAVHQYNIIDNINDSEIIKQKLSSDADGNKFINDSTFQETYDISAVSKLHRFTFGKADLTFSEDGILSCRIDTPIDTHISSILKPDTEQQFVIAGSTDSEDGQISGCTLNFKDKTRSLFIIDDSGRISANTEDNTNSITSNFLMNVDGKINYETKSTSITCTTRLDTDGVVKIKAKSSGSHTVVTMKSNGTMQIDTTDALDITTANTITAKTNSTTITSPTVTINGDTTMNGKLHVTGVVTTDDDITASGNITSGKDVIAAVSLNNHIHPNAHGSTGTPT